MKTNADEMTGNTEETLSSELGELITTIARRLRRGSIQRLSSMGISFTQARVLKILSRATTPMRMSDIARKIEVVPRSATTLIEALEERGLVRREIDPTDRRSVIVALTKEARGLLSDLDRARNEASSNLFLSLDQTEKRALLEMLSYLVSETETSSSQDSDRTPSSDGSGKP